MVEELVKELKLSIFRGIPTDEIEAKLALKIDSAINDPEFMILGIDRICRVLDKCEKININTIESLIKTSTNIYGDGSFAFLKHIKCESIGFEATRVLKLFNSVPLIHETLSGFENGRSCCSLEKNDEQNQLVESLKNEIFNLKKENKELRAIVSRNHDEDGFDVDWEALYQKEKESKEKLMIEMTKKESDFKTINDIVIGIIQSKNDGHFYDDDLIKNYFDAIKKRDLSKVQELLSESWELIEMQNYKQQTMLHVAAKNNWNDGVLIYIHLMNAMNMIKFNSGDDNYMEKREIKDIKLVDINSKDGVEMTPLMYAIKNRNIEIFHTLINAGAINSEESLNDVTYFACENLLLDAARDLFILGARPSRKMYDVAYQKNSVDLLRLLVKNELYLNEKDEPYRFSLSYDYDYGFSYRYDHEKTFGCYSLNTAVERGSLEMVELLIQEGVSVNAEDDHHQTPLLWAVENDKIDIVKLLVAAGANLNSNDVLLRACKNNNLEILKLLISTGNIFDSSEALLWAVENDRIDIVNLLISAEVGLNSKKALLLAVESDKLDIVKLLVTAGADISSYEMLSSACKNNNLEMVKFLISAGADVSSSTMLFSACKNNNLEMVKILISAGADISSYTMLSSACQNNNLEMVKFLISAGADPKSCYPLDNRTDDTPLRIACDNQQYDIIDLLIQNGAKMIVNDLNRDISPMIHNIGNGVAEYLLKNGCDVDTRDSDGQTQLMIALKHGNTEAVKFLISHGADVNATNAYNETPLFYACLYSNSQEMINLIISKGANIEHRNKNQRTPLFISSMNGCDMSVKTLLQHGADVYAADSRGYTPLDMAHGSDTKKLLKSYGASGDPLSKFKRLFTK